MPNDFPTSPEVLAEASAFSLSDLAIMDPGQMSPEAELAYIAELRAYRERYERALGQGALKRSAAKVTKAPVARVILDGPAGGGDTTDVEF